MLISGAFSGLAGYVYFFYITKTVEEGSAPLLQGFDGIVIALVAFNSAIGIFLTAGFFAIFRTGTSMASTGIIDDQVGELVIALMFYLIGISSVFLRFRPDL
jgi:simple sugar transport system permease protein